MSVVLEKAKNIAKKLNKKERWELGQFCLKEIGSKKEGKVILNAIRIDTANFKFNRDEANAR